MDWVMPWRRQISATDSWPLSPSRTTSSFALAVQRRRFSEGCCFSLISSHSRDGVFDERAHSPLRHSQPSVGVSIPRNERRDSTDLPAHSAADAKRTCLKTTGCIQIRQSSQAAKEATIATRLITTRSKTKAKRLNRTVCCTGAILVVCRTSIVRLSYENMLDQNRPSVYQGIR